MLSSHNGDTFAKAFEYPDRDLVPALRALAEEMRGESDGHGAMADAFTELAAWLEEQEMGSVQERYTRLFDLKPMCTMNLGWHLFGETYQRGALLASLAGELDERKVPHRHDLPDYLPTLLRLLAQADDDLDRQLLVHAIILPGIEKINLTLKGSTDPWPGLLRALPGFLNNEVPRGEVDIPLPRRPLEVLPPC